MNLRTQFNEWGSKNTPFVFLIDFEGKKPLAWPIHECPERFKYNFQGVCNHLNSTEEKTPLKIEIHPPDFEDYAKKFKSTLQALQRGDSFIINLTTKGKLYANRDMASLFEQATSKYKFMLDHEFVCFSPETFIQIKDQKINCYPMKGTIDAALPNAAQTLLLDPKESAEHATIVDLLRNDMSMVAKNIRLKQYRFYEEVRTHQKTIGQMSSWIQGDLAEDYRSKIGDIIFDMLPAGSISGAPKPKTKALIKSIEGEDRGYYTGIAGFFDGDSLDSSVLIRFLEADGTYRCGGGITYKSELQAEYEELIQKMYVPIF